jgi:hypothetical protein
VAAPTSVKLNQTESNHIGRFTRIESGGFQLGKPQLSGNRAPMNEDTETLAELMLHADQFCSKVEDAINDVAPVAEEKDLRTKIGQCRNQLAYLQEVFNDGKLNIENPAVRADFRQLVLALLWIAFYARNAIDFRIFRMLVRIESGFTYLLVSR